MLASSLGPRIAVSKNADQQLRKFPRLMVMLVVVLTLVNVAATVLMAGS